AVGGLIGLEDRRQQAVSVQPLNPLAVAFVGLGPTLDLFGELRRGGDDVQASLQQGKKQDMAVGTGGLQGHGGDAAVTQPGDELAQPGGVRRELADGLGAVGGGADGNPVAEVADVDATGTGVADGQGGQLGGSGGLARGLGQGAAGGGGVANDHGGLYDEGK